MAERCRVLAVLATAGLTAIGGAFGAGEIFLKNGQVTASPAMAILTGVAMLCYVGTLALASAVQRQATIPELVAPIRMPRPRTPPDAARSLARVGARAARPAELAGRARRAAPTRREGVAGWLLSRDHRRSADRLGLRLGFLVGRGAGSGRDLQGHVHSGGRGAGVRV